ncbi:MAG TPA: response regulator transcription factor, partial [Chthoniobacteraceae bacterium]
ARTIGKEPDLIVCGEAGDAASALEAVSSLRPDLLLTDITLPDASGLELIHDVRQSWPTIPILVYSMHEESLYAERALRAGASGYVVKSEPCETLIHAIRRVLAGEIYLAPRTSARILEAFSLRLPRAGTSPMSKLSEREFEVFQFLGEGLAVPEIAGRMQIGKKTVETHRLNIKKKLVMRSVGELIAYAARWISGSPQGQPRS